MIKIHRILEFTQSSFLLSYVELNTELRQNARNEFEKSLFKLMVNSCFVKFIEDQRNRVNFKLLSDVKKLEKSMSKSTFKRSVVFSENLFGIHFYKSIVKLNKKFQNFTLEIIKCLNLLEKD